MKKAIAAIMTAFMMFFCFIGVAGAATTSGKLHDTIDKQFDSQNYDYDKGSLVLKDVKSVHLKKKVDDLTELKMAVAQYDTVRQDIFFTTHTEVVYVNPSSGEVVPPATAEKADEAKAYKDNYKDITGDYMHLGVILSLLALLLLVPAYFAYIWAGRQHSALNYQLKNNLLDGVGRNNYS